MITWSLCWEWFIIIGIGLFCLLSLIVSVKGFQELLALRETKGTPLTTHKKPSN